MKRFLVVVLFLLCSIISAIGRGVPTPQKKSSVKKSPNHVNVNKSIKKSRSNPISSSVSDNKTTHSAKKRSSRHSSSSDKSTDPNSFTFNNYMVASVAVIVALIYAASEGEKALTAYQKEEKRMEREAKKKAKIEEEARLHSAIEANMRDTAVTVEKTATEMATDVITFTAAVHDADIQENIPDTEEFIETQICCFIW